MNEWRKIIAVGLIFFCLHHLSLVKSLSAASGLNPASIKQQVDEFGVGAKVGLKLAGGEKLRGSIGSIDDQGFLVKEGDKAARRIAYDQVVELKLTQRVYRANGDPDPIEARRVVLALGVGKHVVVKFGGKELHGHIQTIEGDHLTVLPDREAAPVQISYSEVRHLEKNLSMGATIVLVVLIVAGVVVATTVAATR